MRLVFCDLNSNWTLKECENRITNTLYGRSFKKMIRKGFGQGFWFCYELLRAVRMGG